MKWCLVGFGFVLLAVAGSAAEPASRPPVVFRVSDPVLPNETVMLFGDDLAGTTAVQVARLADSARTTELSKNTTAATILETSDTCVKFVLPTEFKPGVFACRVTTPAGATPPLLLNRPQIWWAQGETGADVAPGGRLRVFGKCLTVAGAQEARLILSGPQTVKLTAKGDTWALATVLPKDVPPGSYELRVHPGTGGEPAWSAPGSVTVAALAAWPDNLFNVKEFGAVGTGAVDDTRALEAALAAAGANGGGIVYFPRGRYLLCHTLTLPRFTVLRGESRELVNICWPDSETPLPALLRGTNSFRVEELSLFASNYVHGIVGDLGSQPDAGNIRLHRVLARLDRYRGHMKAPEANRRFASLPDSAQGDTVQMGGANLVITDCDLYGSGRSLYLSQTRGVYMARNTFYNGRLGWYCITGSDGLILEDSSIIGADLMSTGGGLNTFQGAFSQNVYYARNTLKLMHGWDREAMTSDTGGGAYYGKAAVTGPTTLRLEKPGRWGGRPWRGAAVIVVWGRGHGQFRQVADQTEQDVTLDRPWDVPPDATSLFSITMRQEHYLLIGNDFSDAGISVQFYGNSIEHIVAGNRARRAGGFQNIGKLYGGNYAKPPEDNYGHQPSWFCQFLDNRIEEGNIYRSGANNAIQAGESVIGIFGWPPRGNWPWPYNLGTVVRRNFLQNNAKVFVGGSNETSPMVQDALVEANEIGATDVGIEVQRAVRGVVLRANRFNTVRTPFTGAGLAVSVVTPEQRFSALQSRLQALAADCGIRDNLTRIPEVLKALTAAAAGADPAATAAAERNVLAAGLRAVATRTASAPWPAVAPWLGLQLETDPASTLPGLLQNGAGGDGTLVLAITPAQALAWDIQAEPIAPDGWKAQVSPTASLQTAVRLPLKLTVPAGTWGRQSVSLKLHLIQNTTRLCLTSTLSVGSGQITEWQVIGPFANASKEVLDDTIYAPEQQVELGVDVSGMGGNVRWQPARTNGDWLSLREPWKTAPREAVGYAVACVESAQDWPVLLRIRNSGGTSLQLNGELVWAGGADRPAAAAEDLIPVTLRKGDNALLLKLCTVRDEWRFAVELLPSADQPLRGLRIIPATAFAGRTVFAPAAPARPVPHAATGELAQPGGVDWQLLLHDKFDRKELGDLWRVALGNWKIADGQLLASGGRAFLAYAKRLPLPFRIEYDARVPGAVGADVSAFWLRDPADYGSGILAGFGSNGNSTNKIMVNGEQVASAAGPLVIPGSWHHVIVQGLPNGEVQMFVDSKRAILFRLSNPGPAKFPGLWTWDANACFRNVRIFTAAAK